MKKIILALGVAATLCGLSACDKGGSSQSAEDKAFADSLGQAFGTLMGKQLQMQTLQMKAEFGDKFDMKEYERGIQAAMKLDTANISYIIGMSVGQQAVFQTYQWNKKGVKVTPEIIGKAIIAALSDTTTNGQDAYYAYNMLNNQLETRAQAMRDKAAEAEAEANAEAGKKYVSELQAKDSGIKSTESGLAYKIENEGEGTKVQSGDNVKVIYTGKHINGETFDSSNGEAVEFNVDGVVSGFAEGLKLLGKGGKATLYIPGDLAYGLQGVPRTNIGPNEMLVFDVEIVEITPAEAE